MDNEVGRYQLAVSGDKAWVLNTRNGELWLAHAAKCGGGAGLYRAGQCNERAEKTTGKGEQA